MNATDHQQETFLLYGREECHLCQEMVLSLQQLQVVLAIDFKFIDIDQNPTLVTQYGDKIPVLIAERTHEEICHYHLNRAVLDAYLDKFR